MASCEITSLALDMDGTLLTSDKRVTDDTLVTLRALQERGLSIFAVTGKAPRITARCLAPLRLPMVCLDGAVHVAGGELRWVDDATIDDRLAARLLHDCGGPCYVLADGATQVRGAVDEVQYADWSDQIGPLGAAPLRRVTHLVFTGRERVALAATADRVLRLAREEPGEGLSVYLTEAQFHGCHSLFIRSAACTKLRGARAMARRLHFPLDATMFIGDWVNDIPLLQAVRFPVAMRHAPRTVSECARAVTLFGNDEEGVSRFLRAYFASAAPAPGLAGETDPAGRTGTAG